VIDLGELRAAFQELSELAPIGNPSGQKHVLRGKSGDRDVCLKLIKRPASVDERTDREIEAVSRLQSEYVPRVLEHGERTIGGVERIYIVEEFVAGQTLRDVLRSSPKPGVPFVLTLVDALLHACVDFESNQLVHRDIKPDNLIVDGAGKVWVIDFGIVRLLDRESVTKTSDHFGVFTPGYGAPEQVRNMKPQINVRADLFSVGVVAYEGLAGTNPYLAGAGDMLEVIRRMTTQDLPPLRVPEDPSGELSMFVGTLAARFPSRRPQSAAEALAWFAPISAALSE
jgi:serine/threonine-protein kinase